MCLPLLILVWLADARPVVPRIAIMAPRGDVVLLSRSGLLAQVSISGCGLVRGTTTCSHTCASLCIMGVFPESPTTSSCVQVCGDEPSFDGHFSLNFAELLRPGARYSLTVKLFGGGEIGNPNSAHIVAVAMSTVTIGVVHISHACLSKTAELSPDITAITSLSIDEAFEFVVQCHQNDELVHFSLDTRERQEACYVGRMPVHGAEDGRACAAAPHCHTVVESPHSVMILASVLANRSVSTYTDSAYPPYLLHNKESINILELGAVVCNVILEQMPEHADAHHLVGLTFMKLRGQYPAPHGAWGVQKAIDSFRRAIELATANKDLAWPLHSYYNSLGEGLRLLLVLARDDNNKTPKLHDNAMSWEREIARDIDRAYLMSIKLASHNEARILGVFNRGVFHEQFGQLQVACELFWEVLREMMSPNENTELLSEEGHLGTAALMHLCEVYEQLAEVRKHRPSQPPFIYFWFSGALVS